MLGRLSTLALEYSAPHIFIMSALRLLLLIQYQLQPLSQLFLRLFTSETGRDPLSFWMIDQYAIYIWTMDMNERILECTRNCNILISVLKVLSVLLARWSIFLHLWQHPYCFLCKIVTLCPAICELKKDDLLNNWEDVHCLYVIISLSH